jgi:MFS family permease
LGLVLEWSESNPSLAVGSDPDRSSARVVQAPRHPRRPTAHASGREDRQTTRSSRLRAACGARLISSIGDGLVLVAFPLLATRLTNNPVLIAGVAFATTVPYLVFGLAGGALADRLSRRKLLVRVETFRMAVALALGIAIVTGHLLLVELYLAAFLITGSETLFDSAEMAVIPQLADEGDLVRANSRFQMARLSGEQFIGPALGGALFAVASSIPVLADASTFAASALLLALAVRPARRIGRHVRARADDGFRLVEPPPAGKRPPLPRQIREGVAWLAREPRLRLITALIALFALCQGLGLGILVIYATHVLHLSRGSFGLFVAITASGNAIGAWAAPRVDRVLGVGRTLLVAGVVGGVAFVTVGATSIIVVAAAALWIEAVAVGVGNVAMIALRQRLIPLQLAGRVSAAMRTTFLGAASVASLLGGGLVVLLGPKSPFLIGGVAQILAALVIGGALIRRLAVHDRQVIDLRETIDLTDSPAAAEA